MRPAPVIRAVAATLMAGVFLALGATVPVAGAPTPIDTLAAQTCPPGEKPRQGQTGWMCVPASDPGDPDSLGDKSPDDSGTTPRVCRRRYGGEEVPCSTEDGIWNWERSCYASPMVPQPPPGYSSWDGHEASEGSIWLCTRVTPWKPWFVPASESPDDPGTVAERVVESIPLVRPTVRLSPRAETYVGLETWLWVNPGQWRTVTGSATAGATVVRVVAEPLRVVWDLGGEEVSCASAGRPWVVGMSGSARTDCSHVFAQTSRSRPGGVLPVTAQIIYSAEWTCTGMCSASSGSLGEVNGFVSEPLAVRVGEIQTIVTHTGRVGGQ